MIRASATDDSAMTLPLRIKRICQTASGGSHVTRYEATLEFMTAPGVDVVLAHHAEVLGRDKELLSQALDAIRTGALTALEGSGRGAVIEVTAILIHPVDFRPHMHEELTREAVRALVAAHPSSSSR